MCCRHDASIVEHHEHIVTILWYAKVESMVLSELAPT